jgi:hypothetical protein
MWNRNLIKLFLALFIISLPTYVVWDVTINKNTEIWYNPLYIFMLAFIGVIGFYVSVFKIFGYINGIVGKEYSLIDNKIAKKILKELINRDCMEMPIDHLIPWATEKFGSGVDNDYIKSICNKLVESNLLSKEGSNVSITNEGKKYANRLTL